LEGENSKEQLDALADRLYYARHPELQGRKIQEDETDLAKEWMLLRNNIEQEVAEKLFHEQHPELERQKIVPSELQRERQQIKKCDQVRSKHEACFRAGS